MVFSQCIAFVDKYGAELWEEFVTNADVKTICQLVGFCSQVISQILLSGSTLYNHVYYTLDFI